MDKNKNSIWFLGGYGIALILLLYFGLNGLIVNVLSDTFPNPKFITILVVIFIVIGLIGLGVRRYINNFAKDERIKIKKTFVGITVCSWIIVLALISFT